MCKYYPIALGVILSAGLMGAQAKELQLSLDVPQCKTLPGKPLPDRYYKVAKEWKEFSWVEAVKSTDWSAEGGGDERLDGSRMYDWYTFSKLDLDGDGVCDWLVTMFAPYSTGGDRDVLNTLYLGSPGGWNRIGSSIPKNRPDGLGWGDSINQQRDFSFSSEDPLVILDKGSQTRYIIGYFNYRAYSGKFDQGGYYIYVWDAHAKTLRELNKWKPGSAAAQVYDFFKRHGAVDPTETGKSRIQAFDPEIEKYEFRRYCSPMFVNTRAAGFAQACKEYKEER